MKLIVACRKTGLWAEARNKREAHQIAARMGWADYTIEEVTLQ